MTTCPLVFKSEMCGYTGAATSCGKTEDDCRHLGNLRNPGSAHPFHRPIEVMPANPNAIVRYHDLNTPAMRALCDEVARESPPPPNVTLVMKNTDSVDPYRPGPDHDEHVRIAMDVLGEYFQSREDPLFPGWGRPFDIALAAVDTEPEKRRLAYALWESRGEVPRMAFGVLGVQVHDFAPYRVEWSHISRFLLFPTSVPNDEAGCTLLARRLEEYLNGGSELRTWQRMVDDLRAHVEALETSNADLVDALAAERVSVQDSPYHKHVVGRLRQDLRDQKDRSEEQWGQWVGGAFSEIARVRTSCNPDLPVAVRELVNTLVRIKNALARMPRETPAPGSASTENAFNLQAGWVWAVDRAMKEWEEFYRDPDGRTGEPPAR